MLIQIPWHDRGKTSHVKYYIAILVQVSLETNNSLLTPCFIERCRITYGIISHWSLSAIHIFTACNGAVLRFLI